MKKLILPTLLSGCMVFGAFAERSVIDFTYAEGSLFSYGKRKAETIDVAMCINDAGLKGMKVTGIKAYINPTTGISNTSLWLSKELTIENKVNIPDIASYNVTPVADTYGGENLASMSITLPQPYVLGEEPVYIGYTLTVDVLNDDTQRYPVILADNIDPNGFFLHMSSSVLKWKEYSETAGGVALIVAQIEGEFPEHSLGIKNYEIPYVEEGEEFNLEIGVTNTGAQAVKNIKYTYKFDNDNTLYEGFAELPVAIEPNLVSSSPVSLTFEGIKGNGSHTVDLTLTEVNGQPNLSAAANRQLTINVIPFVPVHRPLVEEYTSLGCGWCPRGFLAMEMIKEKYDEDEVSICYHYNYAGVTDPMQSTTSMAFRVAGFPGATIDREADIDPYYGSTSNVNFGIEYNLIEAMDKLAVAAIDIKAVTGDDVIYVTTDTKFIQDVENANYQVGYVLVSNGLSNPSWRQTNYFSSYASTYKGTPLEVLTTWSSYATGLVFNDVAVDASAMMGVAGSLPKSIKINESYVNTYKFDISKNSIIQDRENLVATAFIIDKNTGKIVNANKCKVNTDPAGVGTIDAGVEVIDCQYYDLSGRKISNPVKGLYIKVEKLSDGTTRTGKVMISD